MRALTALPAIVAALSATAPSANAQSSRQFRVYVGVTWGGFFESAEGYTSKATAHTFLAGVGVGDWSLRLDAGRTSRFSEGARVTTHGVASLLIVRHFEAGDTRPYVAIGCCFLALLTGVEAPSRGVLTGAGELIVNYFGDGISALPRVGLIAQVPERK